LTLRDFKRLIIKYVLHSRFIPDDFIGFITKILKISWDFLLKLFILEDFIGFITKIFKISVDFIGFFTQTFRISNDSLTSCNPFCLAPLKDVTTQ